MPITLKSTGGGSITLTTPSTASDYTLTFPAQNGTPITTLPSTAGNVLTSNGTDWVSQAPATPAGVPTGGIIYSPSSTAPTGYLKCDNSLYNRSAYPDLSTVTGSPVLLGSELLATSYTAGISVYGFESSSSANGAGFAVYTAASNASTVANGMITTTDGVTWTARTAVPPSFAPGKTAVYINGLYLVPANYWTYATAGRIYQTSSDLVTWTARTASTGANSGYPGYFVGNTTLGRAVISQGVSPNPGACCPSITSVVTYYTSNGTTWTSCTGLPTATFTFLCAGNTGVVGINGGNIIYYSADAATYTNITSNIQSTVPSATTFYTCYWSGTYFYLISNAGVLRSTTGASGSWSLTTAWSGGPSYATSGQYQLFVSGSTFILSRAYGANTGTWLSSDFVTWYDAQSNNNYTGVAGSNFISSYVGVTSPRAQYYTAVSAYNTATQFPVPNANTLSVTSPSYIPRPNAYIKT